MKPIRDLDWDLDIEQIARFTDPNLRPDGDTTEGGDDAGRALRGGARSERDAVGRIMRTAGLALETDVSSLDEVRPEHLLVQVLVRLARHPDAPHQPAIWLAEGVDAAPRLVELASELSDPWDADAVQALLIQYLGEAHGDILVDEAEVPWLRDWDVAAAAASTLIFVVALRGVSERQAFLSSDERVDAAVAVISTYSQSLHIEDAGARRRGFMRAFVENRSAAELAALAARLAATFVLGPARPASAPASEEDPRATIERALDLILGPPDDRAP